MVFEPLRLLLVSEAYLPDYALGSTLYAHALATGLAQHHRVEVLARQADPSRPELARSRRDWEGIPITLINRRAAGFPGQFSLEHRDPALEQLFAEQLVSGRYDVVHFLHTLNLSAGLIPSARRAGMAAVVMLHDYWYLCHRVVLLDYLDRRCPPLEYAAGARCLFCAFHRRRQLGLAAGSADHLALRGLFRVAAALARPTRPTLALLALIARWRQRRSPPRPLASGAWAAAESLLYRPRWMREALLAAQRWIAFSPHVVEHYQRLGLPRERFRILPPGTLPGLARRAGVPPPGPPWVLGYVGGLLPAKGILLLLDAARNLALEPRYAGSFRIELHGGPLDSEFAEVLGQRAAGLPVVLAGPFLPTERAQILSRFHLLVMPSLSEETYSFAVREAQSLGVPALVSDLPAQNAAIQVGSTGWTFHPADAQDLTRVLASLLDQPRRLEQARLKLERQPPTPSFAEHLEAVQGVYAEALAELRQGT